LDFEFMIVHESILENEGSREMNLS